jgi:murein DD-endopeptidase MepM/ murein hydrolase activator NlpD
MKILFPVVCLLTSLLSFAQGEPSIRDLKSGKVNPDTSYVYSLPFQRGKKYLLIQGYMSKMSHKGEMALDFKMKKGTKVCAARPGVVISMREDSDKGGLKPEMLSEGNYIIIGHSDGTHANYWHLKKDGVLVSPGDTVKQGQVIGLSGNTGYSAFAHLHFEVVHPVKGQIPTRFSTKKGIKYLRPGKWHKAV